MDRQAAFFLALHKNAVGAIGVGVIPGDLPAAINLHRAGHRRAAWLSETPEDLRGIGKGGNQDDQRDQQRGGFHATPPNVLLTINPRKMIGILLWGVGH
jgi:hypothetical protein